MRPLLGTLVLLGLGRGSCFSSSSSTSALSKVKPLSTVNVESQGKIPRLEPGLRVKVDDPALEYMFSHLSFSSPHEWMYLNAISNPITPVTPEETSPLKSHRFSEIIVQASSKLISYVKRVIAATIVVANSLTSPVAMKRRPIATAAAVGGVIATPLAARAGVLRKYSKLSPTQRLATTPLFFLTNSQGLPFLQEDVQTGNSDQRIVVYFMSSEDAYDYLDEMAQASGSNANEFRVMATSMEKVVNKIQAKKQSRKLGRYPVGTIFRIQPSLRQCENAEKVATNKKLQQKLKTMSIPMFTAKGLAIKRSSGEIVTPFYFSYEDLKDDWAKLSGQTPSKMVVSVHDFSEVMLLAKGVSSSLGETNNAISDSNPDMVASSLTPAEIETALMSPAISKQSYVEVANHLL